jgi:deoxyhypusine synthase
MTTPRYPCQSPSAPSAAADSNAAPSSPTEDSARRRVLVRRVDEVESLDDLFLHCLPAFGGAYLRRIYTLLDAAIGAGCPMTVAIAGPSHGLWPAPDLAHPAARNRLDRLPQHHRCSLLSRRPPQPRPVTAIPVHEVPIFGDDGALRDEGTIRVTDMAFDEQVLLDQDSLPLRLPASAPSFKRR